MLRIAGPIIGTILALFMYFVFAIFYALVRGTTDRSNHDY